jgi:hypothetical protein
LAFVAPFSLRFRLPEMSEKCEACLRPFSKKKGQTPVFTRPCTSQGLRSYLSTLHNKQFHANSRVCNKCYMSYYSHMRNGKKDDPFNSGGGIEPTTSKAHSDAGGSFMESQSGGSSFNIHLQSFPTQHRFCSICKTGTSLRVASAAVRLQCLMQTKVHIPDGNRLCGNHFLPTGLLNTEALLLIKRMAKGLQPRDVPISAEHVMDILDASTANSLPKPGLDFDDDTVLTNANYYSVTGLTKSHFDDLLQHIPPNHLKDTTTASRRQALATFLMKLRTGLPNSVLAPLLKLDTEDAVQRVIKRVMNALVRTFVPLHVGVNHINREEFIRQHVPEYCQHLMQSQSHNAIVVVDGTYTYIQKSLDNTFQRWSFCMHKNRSLLKPMMIVSPDGYILHCIQHYLSDSHNNDADILKHALQTNNDLKNWFLRGDVFVVDRGYLDAKNYLEGEGFQFKMPAFIPKGEKQLPTVLANQSRLVTKVRFVVEVMNRRWREWRFFSNVVHNKNYKHLNEYLMITCALINCYRARIVSDDAYHMDMAERMSTKMASQTSNLLQLEVETEGLNRKQRIFTAVNPRIELQDFPKLTLQYVNSHIAFGPFQVKQAKWYIAEALKQNGAYSISFHKEKPDLLRTKVQSRHVSSKMYFSWIRYVPNAIEDSGICQWYCQCKAGARTVGCCSHVAAAICYLGHYRYNPQEIPNGEPQTLFLDAGQRQ